MFHILLMFFPKNTYNFLRATLQSSRCFVLGSFFFAWVATTYGAGTATVPIGILVSKMPATKPSETAQAYFSAPLFRPAIYGGAAVSSSGNSISVAGSPWTPNSLATEAAPHFVRIVSGRQAGRVLRVLANTSNTVTVDITDRSSQALTLDTVGFDLRTNDRIEVLPAHTLGSLCGDGSTGNPVKIYGSGNAFTADAVSLFNTSTASWDSYYFNSNRGRWERPGSLINCNSVVIYPDDAIAIVRRANRPALNFTVAGLAPDVAILTKTVGGGSSTRYISLGYPVDLPLSALKYQGWTKGASAFTADTISVWNTTLKRWDSYYQRASDSQWRLSGSSADQSGQIIPAGSGVGLLKRQKVTGSASLFSTPLPYSLSAN